MPRGRSQRREQSLSVLPLQKLLKLAQAGATQTQSHGELVEEIRNAHTALSGLRDASERAMQALERARALLDSPPSRVSRRRARKPERATRGRKRKTRARGSTTVQDRMIAVLAKASAPLKPSELASRMRESGWTTNAKSPGSMVSVYLAKAPNIFVRKKGGGFSLTPKGKTLVRSQGA